MSTDISLHINVLLGKQTEQNAYVYTFIMLYLCFHGNRVAIRTCILNEILYYNYVNNISNWQIFLSKIVAN